MAVGSEVQCSTHNCRKYFLPAPPLFLRKRQNRRRSDVNTDGQRFLFSVVTVPSTEAESESGPPIVTA
jgi:hypothetical protein